MLIKYIKSVLWRVAKCLSYIEEARCLKVKILWNYCGGLVEVMCSAYFTLYSSQRHSAVSFSSPTLHSKTASQVHLHMAANLLPAEINVIWLLQDNVELADLIWHLSAAEQL